MGASHASNWEASRSTAARSPLKSFEFRVAARAARDFPPVTNIRNSSSPHWRGWLEPENRCLEPFNSFAEYAPEPNPETNKDVVWFALNDDRRHAVSHGDVGSIRHRDLRDRRSRLPSLPRTQD
jgi:putative SOS response-associated peptidase YedK